jgi:hypothetical protein
MLLVVRAVAGVIRFGQQGDPHRHGLAVRHSIGQASMSAARARAARRGRVLVGRPFVAPAALGLLLPSGVLLVG